jgi:phage terminase small subunit
MAKAKHKPARDRHAAFAAEYAKDRNATQAAIRAGYSPRTAGQAGHRLLKNTDVARQADDLVANALRAAGITVERTAEEIARIAFGDTRLLYDQRGNLKPVHELDEAGQAMVAGIESEELYAGAGEDRALIGYTRKLKRWDKPKALEQCMSMLAMHKTQKPGDGQGQILTIRMSDGKPIR